MFMTLTGELSWQRLRRSAVDFYSKNEKSLFEPLFRALRGNVRTPSMARWKARGRLYPTVETLWATIGRSWRFSKGVGHFERRFQREGASPTNHCCCRKTRVIAVSCGIKIFAVHCLILSQYTRLTDDGQTDRQNSDSNTVRCITCSRTVKKRKNRSLSHSSRYMIALDIP